MKVIRKKQDDYWNEIQRVLASQEHHENLENSSELNLTQDWPHSGAHGGVLTESDSDGEADSVLGYSTHRNDGYGSSRTIRQQSAAIVKSPKRATPTRTLRTRIDTQARDSTELNADYILGLAADQLSGVDTGDDDTHEAVEDTPLSETHLTTMGSPVQQTGLGTAKRTAPPGSLAKVEGLSSGSSYEPSTPLKADLAVRSTMRPPLSRTSNSKSKRKRTADHETSGERSIANYFTPTRSAEPRPKRSAKTSAEKRNQTYYDFSRMSAREQSQVLSDESRNPFHNCYDCKKATCQKCSHKWKLEEKEVGTCVKKR